MNQKVHVACHFNCLFENEGLLKFRASQGHSKCVIISEAMQDGVVVTTEH